MGQNLQWCRYTLLYSELIGTLSGWTAYLFILLFILVWDVHALCTQNDNTNILCIKLIFVRCQSENLSTGKLFWNFVILTGGFSLLCTKQPVVLAYDNVVIWSYAMVCKRVAFDFFLRIGLFPFVNKASLSQPILLHWLIHHRFKQFFINWDAGYHYSDVIMSAMSSQITSVSIVYSTVCSGADQRKHPGAVTRKMLPFDDVIMIP